MTSLETHIGNEDRFHSCHVPCIILFSLHSLFSSFTFFLLSLTFSLSLSFPLPLSYTFFYGNETDDITVSSPFILLINYVIRRRVDYTDQIIRKEQKIEFSLPFSSYFLYPSFLPFFFSYSFVFLEKRRSSIERERERERREREKK